MGIAALGVGRYLLGFFGKRIAGRDRRDGQQQRDRDERRGAGREDGQKREKQTHTHTHTQLIRVKTNTFKNQVRCLVVVACIIPHLAHKEGVNSSVLPLPESMAPVKCQNHWPLVVQRAAPKPPACWGRGSPILAPAAVSASVCVGRQYNNKPATDVTLSVSTALS